VTTPLDGFADHVCASMAPGGSAVTDTLAPHSLDRPGDLWLWLWPLPADPLALVDTWKALGVTGVCPQQHTDAIVWCRKHAADLQRAGIRVACGLGYITADAINAALDLHDVDGVMLDEEAWHSVSDSDAVVSAVLRAHPEAPGRTIDCYYPLLKGTGWAPVTHAWAPLCGRRAPQCYDDDPAPPVDGWVARRLANARAQYPVLGGTPAAAVRPSVQLYRRSVADHLALLRDELATGGVWCWDDNGKTDASAKVALRLRAVSPTVDPATVGPEVAASLGVAVPPGVVWTQPAPADPSAR
jgi:hypothetical protein